MKKTSEKNQEIVLNSMELDLEEQMTQSIDSSAPVEDKSSTGVDIKDKKALDEIIFLIRENIDHDFSLYKKNTLYRRIQRRMNSHKIHKMTTYVEFLKENPKEMKVLYKELLIGVTSFFRDEMVWKTLEENIIPSLLVNSKQGHVLRAWIPACSTGEEAYSLAILFKEVLSAICPQKNISLLIFATDLDSDAINYARKGIFRKNIVANVSPKRLERYFEKVGDHYRINNEIREMVVFAQQNIIADPPFTKLDILSCRNLLIYMENALQNKLMSLFHYSLNPGGILILGGAETLCNLKDKFKQVGGKLKIYQRLVSREKDLLMDFPDSYCNSKYNLDFKEKPVEIITDIKKIGDQFILQQFSPPCVLVNHSGDIVYINGRTGNYLEPPTGKVSWNIFHMLRDGIRNEFPSAFRLALKQLDPIVMQNLIIANNHGTHIVNVTIKRIENWEALSDMVMIVFTEVPRGSKIKLSKKKRRNDLYNLQCILQEVELRRVREEMQYMLKEMQNSQEELKSKNEELQSTNEELQSTNEELTTSKEEMQSLNEELQTINAELQSRVDDYALINSDMKNLLNSMDVATLFLDNELNIRRFTKQVVKLFKLLESDTGRPITDLATELIYPEFLNDSLEVLRTRKMLEKSIPTRDGSWYRIRIMPYRTLEDQIDGLVITFFDRALGQYKGTEELLQIAIDQGQAETAIAKNTLAEDL